MIQKELQKPIILSLIGVGLTIIFLTFLGKEVVKIATDVLYVTVTGIFVVIVSFVVLRFRGGGSHGKAWIFFLGSAVSWFLGELTWSTFELAYKINPFPSVADVFYLGGYPLLVCFLLFYIKPVKKAITKKMILSAIVISAGLAIPSIYLSYSTESSVTLVTNVLSAAYPIADAIIFVPALIGIALFFKGEVNFSWSLICLGIFCMNLGDLGFQFTQSANTYYTGHPVDIVLMWSYILFASGAYDHLKIFKKDKSMSRANSF